MAVVFLLFLYPLHYISHQRSFLIDTYPGESAYCAEYFLTARLFIYYFHSQGRHMVKNNWTMCPNCCFPALHSELMRYIQFYCQIIGDTFVQSAFQWNVDLTFATFSGFSSPQWPPYYCEIITSKAICIIFCSSTVSLDFTSFSNFFFFLFSLLETGETVCPMCSQTMAATDVKLIKDPSQYLKKADKDQCQKAIVLYHSLFV